VGTVTDPAFGPAASVRAPRAQAAAAAQAGARLAWAPALVVAVYWTVGRIGFVPTDQGFILAAAHRILLGQVPHRDLIWPRPVGTPLIHTLDFLLPGPLFETSTVVAIAEVVAYSIVLGAIAYRVGPFRWRPVQAAGVAAAVLVNLHRFPVMVWPAIDGLLLVSTGFVLVHRGLRAHPWSLLTGFLLLGMACTVKQSFLAAPVFALVYVGIRLRDEIPGRWWLRLGCASAALAAIAALAAAPLIIVFPASVQAHGIGHPARLAAALFAAGLVLAAILLHRARPLFAPMVAAAIAGGLAPGLYVAVIAALGGLSELRTQLSDAAPAYGTDAIREVLTTQTRAATLAVVAAAAGLAIARQLVGRLEGGRAVAASIVVRLALSGLILSLLLSQRLITGGTWGTLTLLAFAALSLVDAAWSRDSSRAWAVGALLACAWMVMLSWGYPWPDLVAGSLGLAALATIWRGGLGGRPDAAPSRGWAMALTALGAAASLAVGAVFLSGRWTQPLYLEPAASSVNAELGDVSPAFGRIRTDATTHEYLLQIKQCVAAHPARFVAVLPDNAAIYPALKLDDPFPIDWLFPPEYAGSEPQLLAAAEELNRRGHFLVLFETVYAADLVNVRQLPAASPELVDAIVAQQPVLVQMRASLQGEPVTCGSFGGIYRP
jgi:hypothetical protein